MIDRDKINTAASDVSEMHKELAEIAEALVQKSTGKLDKLIADFSKNIDTYTTEELNRLKMQLCVETYYLGTRKDVAVSKAECAEAIYKEHYAKSVTATEGTAVHKQQCATLETAPQQAVQLLYNLTANLLKTKLNEAHSVIRVLDSVCISRAAEAKLAQTAQM